jgi:hypothetical protein
MIGSVALPEAAVRSDNPNVKARERRAGIIMATSS